MFSVCFYWCISYSVIASYLLTAVFDARLMRLNKSVIHSFIQVFVITAIDRLSGFSKAIISPYWKHLFCHRYL